MRARGSGVETRARGPWRSTWLRLRRDRWSVAAMVALAVILFLALFGGAIVARIVGHDGARPFPYATNTNLRPVGPWTHVPATAQVNLDQYGNVLPPAHSAEQALLVLGADGPLGRDELIRLLDGARTSLEIALGGVLVALLIAIPVGSIAGYFGGVDGLDRLPLHRDDHGLSAAPLPRLRDRPAEPVAARDRLRLGRPDRRLQRGAPDRHLHVLLPDSPRSARRS